MKKRYDFEVKEIDMPDNLVNKYQKYTCSDNSLIKSKGQYTKEFLTLEEGVERYLDYLEKK